MSEHSQALVEVRNMVIGMHGHAWRLHQEGKVRGDPGVPDMFFVLPDAGRWFCFWYEAKVGRDKLRPEQLAFKTLSDQAGCPVIVGRPCDVVDYFRDNGWKI